MEIFENIYGIVLIILFFGGSIFVHELGHFLAARKRGLKIERFSIGIGPRIWGWTDKSGVDYRISLFPVGGYVALPQLADMETIEGKYEASPEALPPISYADKMIVAVMGVVFNVIFAFLIACVLWVAGRPVPPNADTNTIGYVLRELPGFSAPSPAAAAGLRAGDTILAVDGSTVEGFPQIMNKIALGDGQDAEKNPEVRFTVKRGEATSEIIVKPRLLEFNPSSGDRIRTVGILPAGTLTIEKAEAGSPADRAGLKAGDTITAFNGTPVYSFAHFRERLATESPNIGFVANDKLVVQKIEPQSAAERAGIKPGDIVTTFNGAPIASLAQFNEQLLAAGIRKVSLGVRDDDSKREIQLAPALTEVRLDVRAQDGKKRVVSLAPTARAEIVEHFEITFQEKGVARRAKLVAVPDNALEKKAPPADAPRQNLMVFETDLPADSDLSGILKPGEILTRIDQPEHPSLDAPAPATIRLLKASDSATLYFQSGGKPATLDAFKVAAIPEQRVPFVGIVFSNKAELVHQNPFAQVQSALLLTYDSIAALVNPKTDVGVGQLMGVISIARTYYNISDDLRRILWFTLVININLAILNILPLPVLDGGQMLIATIQRILRRPLPVNLVAGAQYLFIGIFVLLMGYIVLYRDIMRWRGDSILETRARIYQRYVHPVVLKEQPATAAKDTQANDENNPVPGTATAEPNPN